MNRDTIRIFINELLDNLQTGLRPERGFVWRTYQDSCVRIVGWCYLHHLTPLFQAHITILDEAHLPELEKRDFIVDWDKGGIMTRDHVDLAMNAVVNEYREPDPDYFDDQHDEIMVGAL